MKKLLCVLMLGMVFGQTEWTTKLFELDILVGFNGATVEWYSLEEVTNIPDLGLAQISIVDFEADCCEGNWGFQVQICKDDEWGFCSRALGRYQWKYFDAYGDVVTHYTPDISIAHWDNFAITSYNPQGDFPTLSGKITLAITTEFPDDDTGDTNGDGYDDVCYEAGAESGDVNGDGELNVLDMVIYAYEIING